MSEISTRIDSMTELVNADGITPCPSFSVCITDGIDLCACRMHYSGARCTLENSLTNFEQCPEKVWTMVDDNRACGGPLRTRRRIQVRLGEAVHLSPCDRFVTNYLCLASE